MSVSQPFSAAATPTPTVSPTPNVAINLLLRFVKILDVGFITVVYFVLAYVIAVGFDQWLGPFDEAKNDKKTIARVFGELILQCWFFATVTYIIRNVVELVPSPFEGILGFRHLIVKELTSAAVFSMILLWNSHNFIRKMEYMYYRVTGTDKPSGR